MLPEKDLDEAISPEEIKVHIVDKDADEHHSEQLRILTHRLVH